MRIPWTRAAAGWTKHPKYEEAGYELDALELPTPSGQRLAAMYMALIRDYAALHCDRGDLTGRERQLATVIGVCRADAADVIRTLVEVGLLDRKDDGGLQVHGWDEMYGDVYKARARKEKYRQRQRERSGTSGNVPGRPVPSEERPGTFRNGTERGGTVDEIREDETRKENYDGSKPVLTPARVGSKTQDSTQPTPAKPTRPRKLGDSAADCAERLEQLPLDQKAVWDLWVELTGRTKAMRLTRKRAGKLRRQVEAHGVDGCARGLAKLAASPHHSGQNDAGKRYDDWHNKPLCDPGSFESWCEPARALTGSARASPVDYDQLADSAGAGFGSPVGESPGRSTANGDAA